MPAIPRLGSTLVMACLIWPAVTLAQQPRFLSLSPPDGFPIIPVMEGWIRHEDGSREISFGYINRNSEAPSEIPLGENNYMEPAQFDGMQPGHFPPGRGTGVFSVTLPPEQADIDVWWHLKTGVEVLSVPGRAAASAYELDFVRPRPQGSLQPLAGFGEAGEQFAGILAAVEKYPGQPRAGEQVTLTVNARDPSERDPADPRFGEPLPLYLHWFKHQGPGKVAFARHESTELPEVEDGSDDDDDEESGADVHVVRLSGSEGIARVYATFSAPGEYLLRTWVENFRAPDSSRGNQCCWTNLFQRVTVRP